MKKKYIVEVIFKNEPLCVLETNSVNQACNFLETINFDSDDIIVHFYREHPLFEFDVPSIREVLK